MNIVCKLALIAILGITVAGQKMIDIVVGSPRVQPEHKNCMQFVNEPREAKKLDKWENNKEWGAQFAQKVFKDKCPEEGRYWVNDKSGDGSKTEYEVGKLASALPQSLLSTSRVEFACMELSCGEDTYFFVGTGAHSLGDPQTFNSESGQPKSMESSASSTSFFLLFLIGFLAVVQTFE